MPPLMAAIGAYVTSAIAAFSIEAFIAKVLISVALSSLMSAVMPKPKARGIGAVSDAKGRTEMIKEPTQARRIIYGETMVSGNIVFADSSGPQNDFMSFILAIAGHEVSAYQKIYFNDVLLTFDGTEVSNERYQSGGAALANIYEHLGADSQTADTVLVANSDGRWTTAHRLRGVAYLHVRMKYDATVWPQGIPKIRTVVRGKSVYDPRDLSTAYSANPALCLRDYLVTYLKVATVDINDPTVNAAANVCDESVTLAAGGSEPRYIMSGTVDLDQRPSDVIEAILSCMAGTITYTGGKFDIHAGAAGAATVTLDEDDLAGRIEVNTRLSRSEIFNAVKAVYVDANVEYQATTAAPITNATYETEDGGVQIVKQVDLPFTSSNATAQRLAKIELERARQQISVKYPARPSALALKIWDVVNVTNASFGWSSKTFRIVGWSLREDMGVNLALREEAASMWSWSTEETILDPAPNTNLPDQSSVAAPGAIAVSDSLAVTASGGVLTVLTVDIDPVNDIFVGKYELEYKQTGDNNYISMGRQDGTRYTVQGVQDGLAYDIRGRAYNAIGVKSPWFSRTYTPIGQATPPEDVTEFAVNIVAGVAHLTWTAVSDVDISHYRIRWNPETSGATWSASVDLVPKVARPATSVDVAAVIGTYLIKAVDLKGNVSANATLIVSGVTVLAGLNAVSSLAEHAAFAGAKINCSEIGGQLQLNGADTVDDWDRLSDIDIIALGDGAGLVTSGTYTFDNAIDLGAVYTLRATAKIRNISITYSNLLKFWTTLASIKRLSGSDAGDQSAYLEARTTQTDPAGSPVWSAWTTFVVGDYTAWGMQFRAQLTSSLAGVSPLIVALEISGDMVDRSASGQDIASNAGGQAVTFDNAFKTLKSVTITGQDLATGDYWSITAKSAAGFTIRFFNSADVGISRTFDYSASGYGVAA